MPNFVNFHLKYNLMSVNIYHNFSCSIELCCVNNALLFRLLLMDFLFPIFC